MAERKASKGFTDDERAAMRERAQEVKSAARRGSRATKADGESDVRAKIAEMPDHDRAIAERLHAIVKAAAPSLSPRTWYGTLGFSDRANRDDGSMWPNAYALKELTDAEEARISALVRKAIG